LLLGYDRAQHFYGGLAEWRSSGRYLVVETPQVVESLLAAGAVLVDVRDSGSFGDGHLPGARSIPLTELLADPAGALAGVSVDSTIVLYDEGEEHPASMIGARGLEADGFSRVRRYAGGVREWTASSRPLE
jgi:rhodanese-related sulfurtransferase